MGSISLIAVCDNSSWILRVAIIPLCEMVAVFCCCGQGDRLQIIHGVATCDSTHYIGFTCTCNSILIVIEFRSKSGVLCQDDPPWIVGIAVIPLCKVVAVVGRCGYVLCGEIVERASPCHNSHCGIV